jgi:hypothetical protein
VRGQVRLSSKCRDSTRANDQNDVRRSRSATVTLDEYCALDESCALIMKPFGKDSAILRFEEFAPNSDIYARVADELDVYFRPMDPPPATKSEAAARAIFMVRNLGFFSANRSAGEAAAMLGLTMTELCSRPIADDVMEFLAGHLLAASGGVRSRLRGRDGDRAIGLRGPATPIPFVHTILSVGDSRFARRRRRVTLTPPMCLDLRHSLRASFLASRLVANDSGDRR